tara:strand:- start:36260 stop:36517 length:258 start_codon:yes stop_codon:yes gene_type:complete
MTMTEDRKTKNTRGILKKLILVVVFTIVYLVSSVPVGLFLYSLKSDIGINVFSKTGFHSYVQCLREQAYKIKIENKKMSTPPTEP